MYVFDSGVSLWCGIDDVTVKMKKETCLKGADAVRVVEMLRPDRMSTCFRITAEAIVYDFKDWETIDKSEDEIVSYLDANLDKLDGIEGIWVSMDHMYKLGIYRDGDSDHREYVAIILELRDPLWLYRQVKIEFQHNGREGNYASSYFMRDHSKQSPGAEIGDNGVLELQLAALDGYAYSVQFTREYPVYENGSSKSDEQPDKKMTSLSSQLSLESAEIISDSSKDFSMKEVEYQLEMAKINSAIESVRGASGPEIDRYLAGVYMNRGHLYYSRNHIDRACKDYDKAVSYDPELLDAYHQRGACYLMDSDMEGALADFTKIIDIDPSRADGYHNRGMVYFYYDDRYELAIKDFSKALELDRDHFEALLYRGMSYNYIGKNALAISDFDMAIKVNPASSITFVNRGWTYYVLGKYELAIEDYGEAIELDPEDSSIYNKRGVAFIRLDENDKAMADYNKALELNPEDPSVYNNIGVVYLRNKLYEKAVDSFTKAIQINGEYGLAYGNRGYAYEKMSEYDLSVNDYSRSIEINPESAVALNNRGRIYYKHFKKAGKGCADLRRACELGMCNTFNELAMSLKCQAIH